MVSGLTVPSVASFWGRLAGDARSGRAPDVAMMQAADFGNLDDHAEFRWLDWPSVRCIFVERQVSSRPVIVGEVAGQDGRRWRSPRTRTWSRHSRRIEPMSLSAKGFCHGLWGAVSTSRIPMPSTRCRTA
jgi:hypothetical protein